ncbi:DEAD/DEAH box helicase family protein [Lactobacillus delbrueckii subsp. bulgaricus]
MTNFDYLKKEKKFDSFVDVAIAAERILNVDPAASILNCRRAMEFAIKWMYSVDDALVQPYQDKLVTLMNTPEFRDIINDDLFKRLNLIRILGNKAAHNARKINYDQAVLCLKNLHIFFDFIAYCYADNYEEVPFNEDLLNQEVTMVPQPTFSEIDLKKLIEENEALKEKLSGHSKEKREEYVPKPLDLSEAKTRKIYIDAMLVDAGWKEGEDWINEYPVKGMPNNSGDGRVDYVLLGDDGIPLAVVEAKKTCVDISRGRHQAKLYADAIENKFHRRPYVFLTNGFNTTFIDNKYPERKVAGFYSKRDLQKLLNLRTNMKKHLNDVQVDKNIAGRYYQEAAIKAVCESLDTLHKRRALLVMATGSGKTRVAVALCKVLSDANWVKNVLFLADRTALVTQAKRSFANLLPNASCTDLTSNNRDLNARFVFSTYQTMMGCIDSLTDDNGKLFTVGHFDLIIVDEAHRSIYNKYRDIFNYFDAPIVGLTATPKDDIDKNTYSIFDLENGVPTYGYELADAVKDGYLVPYKSIETKLKFLEEGICYDDLSDEDKEVYEETFEDEDGDVPKKISSAAMNKWLFNEDTIKRVLNILMNQGLRVDYGEKIGKTIIFAKNHRHAEKILEVFNKEYPELANGEGGRPYAKVIDNYMTYAQSAIDEFSEQDKMPRIAISVDMLDTGVDVPSILNLVFFKKVFSKSKFWQMIGRGTRLCDHLMDDGKDKTQFYIFDFCGNFEFFRMNKGKEAKAQLPLQGALFNLEFQLAYKLQDIEYQESNLISYREYLVNQMTDKVQRLHRDNFAVRQHLKYVDEYANEVNYKDLTYEDCLQVREEIAPLILPDSDDANALRFDALVWGLELAKMAGKPEGKLKSDLLKKVAAVSKVANIPEITAQKDLINRILTTDYLNCVGIEDLEQIRKSLRELIQYIPHKYIVYNTNFDDEILEQSTNEADYQDDSLKNYRAKVESYIKQHQKDNQVIAKLKSNEPLSSQDLKNLEKVLWTELGTKQDYQKEYGDKPIGEFIRSIVGLDMNAAKEAFSKYLNDATLNTKQIYFLNKVIEYIVQNGMMKDLRVLTESPFTDMGSITVLFGDNLELWAGIRQTIQQINDNADMVA